MKMTFFFGADNPLSNWHIVFFVVNGRTFNCVEQYMMFCKAVLFGDWYHAGLIMAATEPREHKRLGKLVRGYSDEVWFPHRRSIVRMGVLAKFSQNPDKKSVLLATAGTMLVEASKYDKIWGCGLAETDPRIHDQAKWPGENLLGQDLEWARDELAMLEH
jgi:ribA/ribD-fused uncharacterized protein